MFGKADAPPKSSSIAAKARIPNPALKPLAFLIGEWRTTGTHPGVPGKSLCGQTSFAWHEGGSFLIMHQEIDEPQFPDGIAIIASDDSGKFTMTYFDERKVSRIYDVTVDRQTMTWHRDDPKLAQRASIMIKDDETLESKGRISKDGGPWSDDLSQLFKRETKRSGLSDRRLATAG
jgi:hypothetical protein